MSPSMLVIRSQTTHMTMRKYLLVFLFLLITIFPARTAEAEQVALPSPNEVVTLINSYRQQNGLAPLEYNSLLASLAQQQSEYQAQIGTITHTGPGGTTPQQRAASAGYGAVYFSEIIYGGSSATPGSALSWWQNSSLHNSIMLSTTYTQIGAGVATDGTMTYFTAELAHPTGAPAAPTATIDPSAPTPEPGAATSTTVPVPVIIPVSKSTPNPDGTVHHIVQQGQTLWTIAAIYGTTTDKIIELNGMESSYIFPGDDLIISLTSEQPASTPGAASLATTLPSGPTPTVDLSTTQESPLQPSPAQQGKGTPMLGTPFSMVVEQAAELPTPTNTPVSTKDPANSAQPSSFLGTNPIVSTLVIAAVVILVLVVLASGFMQNKPGRPPRDDLLK